MSMSIRTNTAALTASRNLMVSQGQLDSSLAKLSSGYRITKASDDAAGLGVSANLSAQYRSYNQAARNANDGLSLVQTAEAALNETSNILTRMRELAMQSASDGIGTAERGFIQEETDALIEELDRLHATTEYNGTAIFGAAAALTFQVGIRETNDDFISIDTTAMDVSSTGLAVDGVDLSADAATSRAALADIDQAIQDVSGFRSSLGASANRLESVLNTVAQAAESVASANSRIRDVGVAAETAEMSKAQILVQAGVSVLAQANQAPQVALKLLG
jgi:flagellin